jgi:hypothetical protein
MKKAWMAGVAMAVIAAAAAQGQTDEMRARFRTELAGSFPAEAREALAGIPVGAETPVALLPIHGDADGWLEGQLKIALTDAGKNCVEGRKDPMWRVILDELAWERKKEGFLDPESIAALGKLQAAKVLVSGAVRQTAVSDRRWRGEVELHATDLETKRHLWGRWFTYPKQTSRPQPVATEARSPLNVGLDVRTLKGAQKVPDELETWLTGRLADLGYRLGTGKDDDLTLTLELESEMYDRTGEYETHRGEAKATLEVRGAEGRVLGTQAFDAKGVPGEGPSAGARNLAYALEEQLGAWLKRSLDPSAIGFESTRLDFTLAGPTEKGADYQALAGLQKAIEGMTGVRHVRLLAQDTEAGTVSYRVTYEAAAFPGGLLNALFAAHPELVDDYLE